MTNLYDFQELEPPVINEEKPVLHPYRKDTILGFVGRSPNRDNDVCINMQRYRHGTHEHKQDYFRKVGGYSLTKRTVKWLINKGASILFIEEMDNSRLVEYQLSQFSDGESVLDWKGEPQWCVPVEDSVQTWSIGECSINHATDEL